jgi:glycosyl hydrolase family 15
VAWTRAALALVAAGAVGVAVVSGGSDVDPRTPAALPGLPAPFLGTAVVGSGGLTAAIDAYGDVVDLRVPGPAGRGLIYNPAARQAAGSVPAGTGVVPRVSVDGGPALPLWRADSISQRYLPGTDVLRTTARFGSVRGEILYAALGTTLACLTHSTRGSRISLRAEDPAVGSRLRCNDAAARRIVRSAKVGDRRWLSRARPLGRRLSVERPRGTGAPGWARRMYSRSLLTLRALTDRRTGAVAAGARDGWAYVWPRDAGTAALAFAAAGYRAQARRSAHFLNRLDLGAAARFYGDGAPVPGRAAQGDAAGWVAVAARAAGIPAPDERLPWRNRPDYREGTAGDYLANAIAATAATPIDGPKTPLYGGKSAHRPDGAGIEAAFGISGGLVRAAGDRASGLDSAAAWAVRPFPQPRLFSAVRRTLLQLTAQQTRFGITPGAGWPGVDPWMAPTAWSAWSLAALSNSERRRQPPASGRERRGLRAAADRDRRAALRLLGDLRRAATPAGELPERVDAHSGIPRSTTPLAWPHAFAILALRELWP